MEGRDSAVETRCAGTCLVRPSQRWNVPFSAFESKGGATQGGLSMLVVDPPSGGAVT